MSVDGCHLDGRIIIIDTLRPACQGEHESLRKGGQSSVGLQLLPAQTLGYSRDRSFHLVAALMDKGILLSAQSFKILVSVLLLVYSHVMALALGVRGPCSGLGAVLYPAPVVVRPIHGPQVFAGIRIYIDAAALALCHSLHEPEPRPCRHPAAPLIQQVYVPLGFCKAFFRVLFSYDPFIQVLIKIGIFPRPIKPRKAFPQRVLCHHAIAGIQQVFALVIELLALLILLSLQFGLVPVIVDHGQAEGVRQRAVVGPPCFMNLHIVPCILPKDYPEVHVRDGGLQEVRPEDTSIILRISRRDTVRADGPEAPALAHGQIRKTVHIIPEPYPPEHHPAKDSLALLDQPENFLLAAVPDLPEFTHRKIVITNNIRV